jgi:Spy/CpxP family protein refolding chaperone
MKSSLWVGVLLAAVFGIGWQSSRLAANSGSPTAERPSRNDGSSDFGGRRGGSSFGGTFFGSPEQLAEELELDAAQREKLDAILEESTRKIAEHGESIHALKEQTRRDVLALLTAEQRATLERKYDEAMERRSRESVERDVEWLRANAGLATEGLARVETILSQYETDKRALLRPNCGPEAEWKKPDESAWNGVRELREKRDAALAEQIDPAMLSRFHDERGRGRSRSDNHLHRDPSRNSNDKP